MLGIYLFAAILGGGLLLLSVLAGGEHDAHGDASGLDAGHDVDHDLGHDSDAGHDVHGGAGEIVLGLFRPRNLTFFLAGFGLTGTLLTLLSPWSAGASLVPSLAMGFGAMVATHAMFTWLKRSDTAVDVVSDSDMEGCVGRVVVPIGPGERGRIACQLGEREVHLVAALAEGYTQELPPGREVVVLSVTDTIAHVMPFESRELPPSTS